MLRSFAGLLLVSAGLSACSPDVTVGIDPAAVTLVPRGTATFRAVVNGLYDGPVTWRIEEGPAGGSIDGSGKYTAPASAGTFRVVATSSAEPRAEASATVTVVDDAILLVETSPASPANDNAPRVKGLAEPRSTVKVYGTADCSGEPLGSGESGEDGTFAVRIAIPDDSTTALRATATNRSGLVSICSDASIEYVEDSTAPAPPAFTRVHPAESADDTAPRFMGSAEDGSLVRLHSDAACAARVAEGPASVFGGDGLVVNVSDGATITIRATATDAAGNISPCSTSSVTYRELAEPQHTGPFPPTRTASPIAWRGPASRIEFVPGTNEAFIDVGGQRHRPVFISVNPQAIQDPAAGWPKLLAQIDLATRHGMPIVDLMLANQGAAFLQELAQRLGNRQVYLWLRFDLWIPELASLGVPILKSLDGVEQPGYRESYALSRGGTWSKIPFYSTLDEAWLDTQKQSLEALLGQINESGIAPRVIGVRTTYMAGGEWFQPPLAFHEGVLRDDPPNRWPWSHPEEFSIGDYSPREKSLFSRWLEAKGLPAGAFPEPAERIQPKLGRTFVVGEDGSGAAAVRYHRFVAERVAWAQSELAKTAKEVTQGKALTMVNAGYLISLALYNGSLHTAFDDVLASPHLDAIAAPYNYNTLGTRLPGFALVPHGPMDSPALHGKLWIHEDDSRPYWSTDGFRATTDWQQDRALLLRNTATSLIHGNGIYYFDLPNQGWFGGLAEHAAETASLYSTVHALKGRLAGRLAHTGPIQAEIAVFIDDDSSHLYPEFGLDGAASYGTSNELMLFMVEKLSKAGAPIRFYLLDDLANTRLDVSAVKAAFFLNTPRLTQAQRQQIRAKLMNGGRVLYFQHVSGLFDESLRPSWALASDYSPGVSSVAGIEGSTSTAVTFSDRGTHSIAYSPRGASAGAIDTVLARAGVHRFATNAVVDGAGSVLMVHSGGGATTLRLRSNANVVDLLTGAAVCAGCSTLALNAPGAETRVFGIEPVPTRRLFRWEFAPGSYGGGITSDERTFCSLPDGERLVACGFTGEDYANSQIIPYGRMTMTHTGDCRCP